MGFKSYIQGVGDSLAGGLFAPSAGNLPVFGGEEYQSVVDAVSRYAQTFYSDRAQPDGFTVPKGMTAPIPRSIFNQYALYNYRGMYGDLVGNKPFGDYFDTGTYNELMGGEASKNISVAKLINFYEQYYPKIAYRAQDFIYGKYYNKIPINHLVTLRRFPLACEDNIFLVSKADAKDPNIIADVTQTPITTAISYLGETAGNKLEDILNFSFGLNWKEQKSEMQSISTGDGGYTQQPFYSKIGSGGQALTDTLKGVSAGTKFRRQNDPTADRLGTTYANFVIGPVNVIDKTTTRDRGFNFSNDVKLNFEYELKSLNYVNPKIAMIDIISNMLTMTINNGQFWGGGHRYYGSAGFVGSQFGDVSKLRNGDFAGYAGTVARDVTQGFKNVFGNSSGGFDGASLGKGLLNIGKNFLGNALGKLLGDSLGSFQGIEAQPAFISGEPTGNWHLTVGNPLNPIVMMGNMYCDNTGMSFSNELGYDDFPMEVKFEIDLKHGKPRDKGDIENMFNAGRGRIYASAAGESDILNLAGKDVGIYGAVPAGTNNIQKTQSSNGIPASNITPTNTKKAKTNNTSVSSEYIENIISFGIDS